jgi:2-amino-4-hydroxy-6-hydroxymethyldihydropteridine diphosphokinase
VSVGTYWIGLGANLGDRMASLGAAVEELGRRGLPAEAVSRAWETAPRELEDQPAFLNAAVRARSELAPAEALRACKEAEAALGRVPGRRYGPRAIDCDLLVWSGGEWREEALEIPHPRLGERRFALLPVLDLDPALRLPDGRALAELEAALDPAEQRATPLTEGPFRPPLH